MMSNIQRLFEGDPRCEIIVEHVIDLLYERARGMPIPSIIGVLELVKLQIIKEAEE